jgi:hypothetical protein
MQTVRDKEGLTYGINAFVDGVEEKCDGFCGVRILPVLYLSISSYSVPYL